MFAIIQRQLNKRRNPKDHGYSVYSEFGPDLRIDRLERLKAKFPQIDPKIIQEWISDYEMVDDVVWTVAEAGGREHNSREFITVYFYDRFPWLDGVGLEAALNRVDYFAWHEGYHTHPETSLNNKPNRVGGRF